MNQNYENIDRRTDCSKHYQLMYSLYTFTKLAIIIGLISFFSNCSPVLNVYLILYCATEGYELLFMLLLVAHKHRAGFIRMVKNNQLSVYNHNCNDS